MIYVLILIIGICVGYGIGLCLSLTEIEKHCQEIIQLNDDWFKHLDSLGDIIYKVTKYMEENHQ